MITRTKKYFLKSVAACSIPSIFIEVSTITPTQSLFQLGLHLFRKHYPTCIKHNGFSFQSFENTIMPLTGSKIAKAISIAALMLALAGGVGYYYITRSFKDTAELKPDFEVDALPFIAEFEKDPKTANARYSEKMITVRGRISAIEKADSVVNIKMANESTGSYVIFALQPNEQAATRGLKATDSISVKGSCSNGTYSDILSVYFISFKRCVIIR